jgi:hypothetical protein
MNIDEIHEMSDQFLQRYRNEKVYFSSMYKFRATFRNEELKIWCSGIVEYRDDLSYEETVKSVSCLECFQFGVLP